jgi:hypothetical protein
MESTLYVEAPKHVKAMRIHRWIAIFYGLMTIIFWNHGIWESSHYYIVYPFFGIIAIMHAAISFGASRLNKLAQICSIIIAIIMLVIVPIGTIVGLYLLRNAAWVRTEKLA